MWSISLKLPFSIVILEDHIKTLLLDALFSELLLGNFLGCCNTSIGVKDILIKSEWISLLNLFLCFDLWLIEPVKNLGITISVINSALWPDLSPVVSLLLHKFFLINSL